MYIRTHTHTHNDTHIIQASGGRIQEAHDDLDHDTEAPPEEEDISVRSVQTFQTLFNAASGEDASAADARFFLQVARSSPCACASLPRLGCARAAEFSG